MFPNQRTYHDPVDDCASVGDDCIPSLEDTESDDWFFGNVSLIKTETDETGPTKNKRDESPPRIPRVHDTPLERLALYQRVGYTQIGSSLPK